MILIILGTLIGLIALFIISIIQFDNLVNIEYTKHKTSWFKDGSPRGFFWNTHECIFFSSAMARQKLALLWLFKTPSWAKHDAEATLLFKKFRKFIFTFQIGVILWFTLTIILVN